MDSEKSETKKLFTGNKDVDREILLRIKSDKQLLEICLDIYQQAYEEATPSADFKKLLLTKEVTNEGWFMKYYLSNKRLSEILKIHYAKHRLSEREKDRIATAIYLGASPRGF